MRRRAIHAAVECGSRKARSRQQHDINLDARGRIAGRHLARGRFGCERRLQLPDRGLEAGDLAAARRARDRKAEAAQDCPHSARMGRAELDAPDQLHSGAAARRHHHHVLEPGPARTCRRSPARLDYQEMRAGAAAAEHRSACQDRDLGIVPAARRGTRERATGDRPFRFDLSGQAAQCAARDRRDIEGARTEAADGLYRLVHPRRRQGRGGFLRACGRARTRPRT